MAEPTPVFQPVTVKMDNVSKGVIMRLSVIGKHHADANGKSLFSATTLSEIEQQQAIPQLAKEAVQLILAEIMDVLDSYQESNEQFSFSLKSSRLSLTQNAALANLIPQAIIAYCMQETLAMIIPDMAQKYILNFQSFLTQIARIAYRKMPPANSNATQAEQGSVDIEKDKTEREEQAGNQNKENNN